MPTFAEAPRKRFSHVKWTYAVDPTGEGFFCPQLIQKRIDYFALKQLRPADAEAVYQCRPGARIGSIFVEADFRYYESPIGLQLGRAHPVVAKFIADRGGIVAQGWDTAMSAESSADRSVCVTVLLVPCEEFHREVDAAILKHCDQHYDVYILDVYRERLDIGDLVLKVREQALKWDPEKIIIEKKASGASVMQALVNTGLPIEGVVPQENKRDRAITGGAGAGSVQGWFKSGRVLFPFVPPPHQIDWLSPFITELKDFTGEKGGTDDQVDAMVHVISYGIREGGAGVQFPSDWQTPEEVDSQMHNSQSGMSAIFSGKQSVDDVDALVSEGFVIDPFAQCCARCRYFDPRRRLQCTRHNRTVPSLGSCDDFDDGETLLSFPRF